MKYLMILPVHYYRIDDETVALGSAFVEHLKLLRHEISPFFNQMDVAMIEMSEMEYEGVKSTYSVMNEKEQDIFVKPHYQSQDISSQSNWIKSIIKFYIKKGVPYIQTIFHLVRDADLIHGGPSYLWTPPSFIYVLFGILLRKKLIFVVDIDFRKSGWMLYKSGKISRKSYLLERYIYNPFLFIQISVARSANSLLLLKGKKLAQDFGKGHSNVKNFLDASHSAEYIISDQELSLKFLKTKDSEEPFRITYFGRLVSYKGIDKCLEAIQLAQEQSSRKIEFHIIGSGSEEKSLREKAAALNIEQNVIFHGFYPFGLELFKVLYKCQLLLATPMREDTPRSAIDAMAAGVPILAFNTYYYQSLEESGAVKTVEWPSVEKLALGILEISQDGEMLGQMMERGVEFAHQNTQEIWLKKRIDWTLEMFK